MVFKPLSDGQLAGFLGFADGLEVAGQKRQGDTISCLVFEVRRLNKELSAAHREIDARDFPENAAPPGDA